MEEENLDENYVEVPTEEYEDSYEDEDIGLEDIAFLTFFVILACAVFAFVMRTISKHLKNVKLKVGNKLEIGVETTSTEAKKDSKPETTTESNDIEKKES